MYANTSSLSGSESCAPTASHRYTAACKHLDKAGQIKSEREAVLAEIYSRKLKAIKGFLLMVGTIGFMDQSSFNTNELDKEWKSHPYFKSGIKLLKP